ncbi:glutamine amidotransferase [Micrococcoides hystricis]|uniref:Glutamine amidotransferase n=1 Tax=Micrococcoides hystricis TaxID=1572761 RepID=A0ABV6PA16_9MICC
MASRGQDSAGLVIFSDGIPDGKYRYSIRVTEDQLPQADVKKIVDSLQQELAKALNTEVEVERVRPDGGVFVTTNDVDAVQAELFNIVPDASLVGYGQHMEILKDVGSPADVCNRFEVRDRSGYQAIGHTRMATESAVTIEHSHPFAPNSDLAVVHNGTFSNPFMVRRELAEQGIYTVTDNDTEVAARLIGRELAAGKQMAEALTTVTTTMDGFYTLLVGTADEFAVVRDSFACKPLVVAETDDYVAVASEYVAMVDLPNINDAQIYEPKPEELYIWKSNQDSSDKPVVTSLS